MRTVKHRTRSQISTWEPGLKADQPCSMLPLGIQPCRRYVIFPQELGLSGALWAQILPLTLPHLFSNHLTSGPLHILYLHWLFSCHPVPSAQLKGTFVKKSCCILSPSINPSLSCMEELCHTTWCSFCPQIIIPCSCPLPSLDCRFFAAGLPPNLPHSPALSLHTGQV